MISVCVNIEKFKIKHGFDPVVGHYKELIIGFKVIYMNTYTVQIEDVSGLEADRVIIFDMRITTCGSKKLPE